MKTIDIYLVLIGTTFIAVTLTWVVYKSAENFLKLKKAWDEYNEQTEKLIKELRNKPYLCPECNHELTLVEDVVDNIEVIGFVCDNCGFTEER